MDNVKKLTDVEKQELLNTLNKLIEQYHDYSCISLIEINNNFKCTLIERKKIESTYKIKTRMYLTKYYLDSFALLFYHTAKEEKYKYMDDKMFEVTFTLKEWKEKLNELK